MSAWRSVSADVVVAAEQAVLAERLDVEAERGAVGLDDDLALEVDRQRVADEGGDLVEQPGDLALGSTIGSRPFLKQLLKKMSA